MVTRRDFTAEAVNAARSVLLELVHLLGGYRDHIVLVGGWVPTFLCPEPKEPHVGSMDVDLALDHRYLTDAGYRTIQQLLLDRGYEQGVQPFIFHRKVKVGSGEVSVEVDMIGGEYEGTGKTHRTQKVQDIRVRKARGVDLAFDDPIEVTIEGTLPEGGEDSVKVRVASIVPFIVMKGMVLVERLKEKDSWDIYYCLVNYPGGLNRLVEEFKPHIKHGLVKEGLEKLAKHFASLNSVGPAQVVNFQEMTDAQEMERVRRDAYERVRHLLEQLGIR
jgi:hypothetical protein